VLKDPQAAFEAIVAWTRDIAAAGGFFAGVVGLSGGADSALVGYVVKAAFGERALGVLMPCHSSAWATERATELAQAAGLETIRIDLTPAFDHIEQGFGAAFGAAGRAYEPGLAEIGALKSCLRAPTLDYAAKLVGGLVVGTGNRDEDGLVRYFQKRGDGAVDLSPIAGLHKSEVYELLEHLGAPRSIIEAPPSADLWGPDVQQHDEEEMGLTYAQVEWAAVEDDARGVVTGDRQDVPADDPALGYAPEEREVLAKVRRMERSTRHKVAAIPAFTSIRALPGLFIEPALR
jgi:NAD+ synthase